MKSRLLDPIAWNTLLALLVAILLCVLAVPLHAQSTPKAAPPSTPAQKVYDTPQQAAEALVQAAASYDAPVLLEIFGRDGKDFIASADPAQDKNIAYAFARKAKEKNVVSIDPKNKAGIIRSAGQEEWTIPIQLFNQERKWSCMPTGERNE